MKLTIASIVLTGFGILGSHGCYSYVKTYDGNGNLLAECNEGGMLFGAIPVGSFHFGSACTGSANPLSQGHPDPIGPRKEKESILGNCPEGSSPQYGQCYPTKPIYGAGSEKSK